MLIEAIAQIGGLAVLFFVCSLLCYCLCAYLLKDEGKNDVKPENVPWERKHYYDPIHSSLMSPPDNLCQPTVYSFKVHNGGHPHAHPHAVINPAILQYPPGHILEIGQNLPLPIPSENHIKTSRISSKIVPTIDLKTYGFRGKSPIRNGGLGESEGWIA